jgi:hypothetical protein
MVRRPQDEQERGKVKTYTLPDRVPDLAGAGGINANRGYGTPLRDSRGSQRCTEWQ